MKLEQELIEYQKLGGHPLGGKKRSPGKPKAPSMMRRNQPTQGKTSSKKTPVKVKQKLPVARKLSQGEEELDLEDELSLDTIKETVQEQSRTNTHRGNLVGNGAQLLGEDFVVEGGSFIQEAKDESMPSYEFNSQIESVL